MRDLSVFFSRRVDLCKNGLSPTGFHCLRHSPSLRRICCHPQWCLSTACENCIFVSTLRLTIFQGLIATAWNSSETGKLICALVFHFRWHRNNTRTLDPAIPPSWFKSLLPRDTSTGLVDRQICCSTAVPAALYLINNVLYLVALRFVSPALLNTALLAKVDYPKAN